MKNAFKILVICDPQLKDDVERIVGHQSSRLQTVYWQRGHSKKEIEPILNAPKEWDLLFSVYSDYIVPNHVLNKVSIPLNVHPALPNYPGVGYDVYPLIYDDDYCGATLHWMEEKCDYGVVLDTLPLPLPKGSTYPKVRKLNQQAVITLFEKWFRIATNDSRHTLYEQLHAPLQRQRGWDGNYSSLPDRREKLNVFKSLNPIQWESLQIPDSVFFKCKP